jgi:hypothetical protein
MSVFNFNDCYVELAGVDYSTYSKSVSFDYSAEMLEDTAMGDTTHSKKSGLKNWTVDIEFYSNFVDNGIDEVLQALTGTEVAIVLRPNKTAGVGDNNPEYRMTGLLESWPPVSGNVGELSMVKAHFVAASEVTRAVV